MWRSFFLILLDPGQRLGADQPKMEYCYDFFCCVYAHMCESSLASLRILSSFAFASAKRTQRSQLAPLGMPNKTCGSSPLGGCGSVTINGKSYDLNQVNAKHNVLYFFYSCRILYIQTLAACPLTASCVQINVADGHDACKVCNCDLAYINLVRQELSRSPLCTSAFLIYQ